MSVTNGGSVREPPARTRKLSSAPQTTRVLGIRHHGPGSARAVTAALGEFEPEVVVIEGPPEADRLVDLVNDPDLVPPVALLAHRVDNPSRAAFWPFAVFSPEWQAMTWAVRHGVPVRFCDLPAANVLAESPGPADAASGTSPAKRGRDRTVRTDPIATLAAAAGHDDPERWWDDVVESRSGEDSFAAIAAAMETLRDDAESPTEEAQREAYMRKVIRSEEKSGRRVAVVCGAWHVPALLRRPPVSADNVVLKGIPKAKIAMTWVPWTHSRLAFASGYGAGVDSPGWYHHLFTAGDQVIPRWLTKVAHVLRAADLPASSAHVIEAVRLADSLATLRHRPLPGLSEVTDATRAVLCEGNETAVRLVLREAVVGEALGTVPDCAVQVPLAADLVATARRLRLPQSATPKEYVLDLRNDNDRARSHLLHRLQVLDVPWGEPLATTGTGTFKEGWTLEWQPEFSVRLVEASLYGTTLASAAAAKLITGLAGLASVTSSLEQALVADLSDALPPLLQALDDRAAHTTDVAELLAALPALVTALRYGSVRGIESAALEQLAAALLVRGSAGLGAASAGLAEDAAVLLRDRIEACHRVVPLLPEAEVRREWYDALGRLVLRRDVPGLLAGRVVRLLLDAEELTMDEAADHLGRALSYGSTPAEKALWAEGFLTGEAILLIHDDRLLGLLDAWLLGLDEQQFTEVLPLLRRTFGRYAPAERRQILDLIGQEPGEQRRTNSGDEPDLAAAAAGLATVGLLLGRQWGSVDVPQAQGGRPPC